jgi:hypothetical protein
LGVNVAVSILLGTLFLQIGDDGSKIFDNYNLLFSILMHHVGSTLMLNIINCKLRFVDISSTTNINVTIKFIFVNSLYYFVYGELISYNFFSSCWNFYTDERAF